MIEVRARGRATAGRVRRRRREVTLDPAYVLGTPYDLEIIAADGHIRVSYNGTQKADILKSRAGWYFKTGSYVQSNLSRGDAPDARARS